MFFVKKNGINYEKYQSGGNAMSNEIAFCKLTTFFYVDMFQDNGIRGKSWVITYLM